MTRNDDPLDRIAPDTNMPVNMDKAVLINSKMPAPVSLHTLKKQETDLHKKLRLQSFLTFLNNSPLLMKVVAPLTGIGFFLLGWTLLSASRPELPGPHATWLSAVELFSDPFYVNGPNDQGIGWNILSSLRRVGIGFGLAALMGIPLGFIIGRSRFISGMLNPIISILRPVSPLAWLPIGLMVFKAAEPASIWVIFISAIWPIILNTSAGVAQIPQDYLNVARVLNLSEWKVFTKILLPSTLPHLLTGIRLSIGVAWLVIVAAEMLTGGVGLGFWVWDEWNNLNVAHILIAIFIVGIVGLIIEKMLALLTRLLSRGGVPV